MMTMKYDYNKMYKKIFRILGDLTPLKADCGKVCGGACCKSDEHSIGMRLFPFEESTLPVKVTEDGVRLVVCEGTCNREDRPLSCRIFPFFPTVDERGRVYVEPDYRGARLCPMIEHMDDIVFDRRFFAAVKKVGKILAKNKECLRFLQESTEETDTYKAFLSKDES